MTQECKSKRPLKMPKKWQRKTDAQVAEALRTSGGLMTIAAKKLGVDVSTVSRRVAQSNTLRSVIDEITNATLDMAEASLFNAIKNGESWGTCFYLKCKGKSRGYVERQEITGKDGGAIQTSVASTMSDEELRDIAGDDNG